jgi:hypothetical protein
VAGEFGGVVDLQNLVAPERSAPGTVSDLEHRGLEGGEDVVSSSVTPSMMISCVVGGVLT